MTESLWVNVIHKEWIDDDFALFLGGEGEGVNGRAGDPGSRPRGRQSVDFHQVHAVSGKRIANNGQVIPAAANIPDAEHSKHMPFCTVWFEGNSAF